MKRRLLRSGWMLLALVGVGGRVEAQVFRDPAPTLVHAEAAMPAPEPMAQPGLTFHGPPRPLAAGAVTHDWRCFLGPTHNAGSTETPLLKRFGKGAPALVREVEKGAG